MIPKATNATRIAMELQMTIETRFSYASRARNVGLTALAATALALLFVVWQAALTSQHIQLITSRHSDIEQLRGIIAECDEAFAASSSNSITTGSPQRQIHDQEFECLVLRAVHVAESFASSSEIVSSMNQIRVANANLIKMENQAAELTLPDPQDEAMEILFNQEYDQQKRNYSAVMNKLNLHLHKSVKLELESESRRASVSADVAGIALLMLVLIWFMAIKTIERWEFAIALSQEMLARNSAEPCRSHGAGELRVAD